MATGSPYFIDVPGDASRGRGRQAWRCLYDSNGVVAGPPAVTGADRTRIHDRAAWHCSSAAVQTTSETGGAAALPAKKSDIDPPMTAFVKTILFTDTDGRARFREENVALPEGSPQSMLSPVFPATGYQLRESPVGFRSQFHCTPVPQWVFILRGQMEIGLQDGSTRMFQPGQHFYSADVLPAGASFDPNIHGHWSRQAGADPLQTLFVKG